MNFNEAKEKILVGLVGIAVGFIGWMAFSVNALNLNMAVIVEKVSNHESRIHVLETK